MIRYIVTIFRVACVEILATPSIVLREDDNKMNGAKILLAFPQGHLNFNRF